VAICSGGATVSILVQTGRQLSMDRRVTRARAAAALVTIEHPRLTLAQLAALLQRDPSTLSEAANRFRRRAATDPDRRSLLLEIRAALEKGAGVSTSASTARDSRWRSAQP
jgi:hypothetical protein